MSRTKEAVQNFAPPAAMLVSLRNRALVVGVIGAILTVIGAFVNFDEFLRGYLIAYIWVMGLSLGCMALLMTGHMSGGNWWMISRRIYEAGVRVIPMLAVLFLPILLGAGHLYEWMHIDPSTDKVMAEKAWWLTTSGWHIRAVIYLVLWVVVGYLLTSLSAKQDVDASPAIWKRLKVISGIGLLVWAFSLTGAAVDWGMSLDPHWYSTIYGMLFMIGEALSAMAFSIMILSALQKYSPMTEVVRPDRLHDLGKLLLAFTMVWAYFSFSQWLIIWMGNLPEEISWYLHRIKNGWGYVALLLVFGQFALPFAMLLSRNLKRQARRLVPVALLVILMRAVDLYWYVVPNPGATPGAEVPHLTIHWVYITALVALGGLWLAAFAAYLNTRPLLVRNEPMLGRLWEQSHGH